MLCLTDRLRSKRTTGRNTDLKPWIPLDPSYHIFTAIVNAARWQSRNAQELLKWRRRQSLDEYIMEGPFTVCKVPERSAQQYPADAHMLFISGPTAMV
jgi:hypothetical protein